ncbi:MAG: MazG nucleotide pyrophosphohydrolase domain-containing protein [Candidatus Gracilibacteria bacterium]
MKNLQLKVKKFCLENHLDAPIEIKMLDLISEFGEVSKEVIKMSDYGKHEHTYREEFASELGDLFYSLITVANTFDVDLEVALEKAMQKYEKRLKKGGAGSENE